MLTKEALNEVTKIINEAVKGNGIKKAYSRKGGLESSFIVSNPYAKIYVSFRTSPEDNFTLYLLGEFNKRRFDGKNVFPSGDTDKISFPPLFDTSGKEAIRFINFVLNAYSSDII